MSTALDRSILVAIRPPQGFAKGTADIVDPGGGRQRGEVA
jgi:hypothetical protein